MGVSANPVPLHLLSAEQMPHAPRTPPHARWQWLGSDTEERFGKRPHPTLGPEAVQYRFNAHGYRCAEFDVPRDGAVTVIALGASEVLGTGLPADKTFCAEFARRLGERLGRPAIYWNLGAGGSSADYIARMLASALPVLRPDVALFSFPHPARREHLSDDGRIHLHNREGPGGKKFAERLMDPEKFMLKQSNMNLSSEANDTMNLYKNYKVCELLCAEHSTMWLFSATRDAFLEPIARHLDVARWVRPGIGDLKSNSSDDEGLALARDMQHPGIGPHSEMAERLLAQLEACDGERLRALARAAPVAV